MLTTASNSSNEGIVDVDFATWTAVADEIINNAALGIMDHKEKQFYGFHFYGNIEREYCALKATL